MRLGPDFRRFGRKVISCRVRNQMLDKIVFRQSHVFFFTIFSSAFFFAGHYFIYVPAGFSKVLLPWWYFKESCFRKDMYTLSLASFQPEHLLRMHASSRFWLW